MANIQGCLFHTKQNVHQSTASIHNTNTQNTYMHTGEVCASLMVGVIHQQGTNNTYTKSHSVMIKYGNLSLVDGETQMEYTTQNADQKEKCKCSVCDNSRMLGPKTGEIGHGVVLNNSSI